MTTKLKMFNKTLIKLGCETINETTADVKSARLINEIYDDIVKEELQKHCWIFAKNRTVIYANDILNTVKNVASVTVDGVVLSYDKNVLTITAANVGEEGNSIVINSTNKKIVCSSATLTGGSADTKASATITFNVNADKYTKITIGTTELVAGVDFEIGAEIEGLLKREFDLPADLLLLLEIDGFNALSTYPYQYGAYKQYDVAGKNIYCNKDSIDVSYTAAVDESKFDFNFINAVCCRISYELAEVLTEDDQKKQTWMNEYLLAIKDAKRVNAIQLPNASLGSGILERARVW